MLIIPAIDLKDGACVRLRQGRMEEATVFAQDPLEMAAHWVKAGCRRLHVVDLNGAFAGRPVNGESIAAIARGFPELPIQVGGGIRSLSVIEAYLATGVAYVIIGTQAVQDPALISQACQAFPGQIMLGLDARDGWVATQGWAQDSQIQAMELASRFARDNLAAIIYTDIARDGMLQGCNIAATAALANAVTVPVIASGGIHRLDNIHALLTAKAPGIKGAIIGRALYEGTVDFTQAQALGDQSGA